MAMTFYLGGVPLWPPPWKTDSPLMKALSYLWFVLMFPIMVATTLVIIPYQIFLNLIGKNVAIRDRAEVSDIIEDFVDVTGKYDFGEFLYTPIQDPELDTIRLRCLKVPEEFPSEDEGIWCSEEGVSEIGRIGKELRRRDG